MFSSKSPAKQSVIDFAKSINATTSYDDVLRQAQDMRAKGMRKELDTTIVDTDNNLTLLCSTINTNPKATLALLEAGVDGSITCGYYTLDREIEKHINKATPLMMAMRSHKFTDADMAKMLKYPSILKTKDYKDSQTHKHYAALHYAIYETGKIPYLPKYAKEIANIISKIELLIDAGANKKLAGFLNGPPLPGYVLGEDKSRELRDRVNEALDFSGLRAFANSITSKTDPAVVQKKIKLWTISSHMKHMASRFIVDTKNDYTLLCSTIKKNPKAALALLDEGVDGSVGCGFKNVTPLMFAARTNIVSAADMDKMLDNTTIIETLNNQDLNGVTALHHAVLAIASNITHNISKEELNLAYKPSSDKYDMTAIQNALSKINLLIKKGSKKNIVDVANNSAITLTSDITDNALRGEVLTALEATDTEKEAVEALRKEMEEKGEKRLKNRNAERNAERNLEAQRTQALINAYE